MTKKTTHFFPMDLCHPIVWFGGNLTANLATLNFRIDRLTPSHLSQHPHVESINLSMFFQITKSQHTSPTISPYFWWFEFDMIYFANAFVSFDWKLPSFMVGKKVWCIDCLWPHFILTPQWGWLNAYGKLHHWVLAMRKKKCKRFYLRQFWGYDDCDIVCTICFLYTYIANKYNIPFSFL